MPKKKQFEKKVNVCLPKDLAEWLEGKVKDGTYASLSHGIRKCVQIVKEQSETLKVL